MGSISTDCRQGTALNVFIRIGIAPNSLEHASLVWDAQRPRCFVSINAVLCQPQPPTIGDCSKSDFFHNRLVAIPLRSLFNLEQMECIAGRIGKRFNEPLKTKRLGKDSQFLPKTYH
ncbi:MAG: hypothetical protein ACI9FB_002396 [Candidatus Azotimanducaceae bacterium]|jgi:hypothetical protein